MQTAIRAVACAFFLAVFALAAPAQADEAANKHLVREFTDATNAKDWDALARLLSDDFVRHSAATAGPPVTSRDQFIALQESFLKSFPDQKVTIDLLVAEGDYVAARAHYSGTLLGPLGGTPATGKSVNAPFLGMFRVDSGRIAELWVEWDNLNMMSQLGLFPPPAPGSGQ